MNFLYSISGTPTQAFDASLAPTAFDEDTLTIINTPFSLPFSRAFSPSFDRTSWLLRRKDIFFNSTYPSVLTSSLSFHKPLLWIIYLARGDKSLLSLPSFSSFNNVLIHYVEVDCIANQPDDFYRKVVIPGIIKETFHFYASLYNFTKLLSLRIDSDDLIDPDYLIFLPHLLGILQSKKSQGTFYFHFPCGSKKLFSDLSSSEAIIWIQSSFVGCFYDSSFPNSVFHCCYSHSHDSIPRDYVNYLVITDKPLWCIQVGHGNLSNDCLRPYFRNQTLI